MATFPIPCPSSEVSRWRRWWVVAAKLALSEALAPSQNSPGP